ncbi:MAG: phosphotransferase family protein [Ilumatobacteraceae bacterium]|jgi:aminoglycoside phosphotransferase (APT) family kinase protein|nr:acyl-CoA dehydrogenase [Actinomycetes bacterium]
MVDAARDGIATATVTPWLAEHVTGFTPPFTAEVIAGGHSNLTFKLTDARGTKYVLRRPPLSHTLASAHDMGREHRIIHALRNTDVPVAPALAMCDDPAVNGAPFYVMGFVDGHVIRDATIAERVLTEQARRTASESLIDTMAAIHAVNLENVGLADLARHEGYIARQLKRWYGQFNAQKTRDLPLLDQVHDALAQRIPEQGPATIVHGDYRLDNCIVNDDGRIAAVLDWEICTLGDPLADLGLLMAYYTGPDDESSAWQAQANRVKGFLNRADLVERYARITKRDVSQLDFYTAFAFWKLACIIEGVYARYLGGALGDRSAEELAPFAAQVESAVTAAHRSLSRLH